MEAWGGREVETRTRSLAPCKKLLSTLGSRSKTRGWSVSARVTDLLSETKFKIGILDI